VVTKGGGVNVVLSLGRLHPLKGLDLLITAWAEVRRGSAVPSWQLVIAGPDEQGTKETLKVISEKLKIRVAETSDLERARDADVVFMGAVHGDEKEALMRRADLFVLPSRSENFGMVVGEALSCGVPVVTTAVGPWGEGMGETTCRGVRESAERGLLVVETSVEGLVAGLRRMMALSAPERTALGRNGRAWVQREFGWETVAKRMVSVYAAAMKERNKCHDDLDQQSV